jgi:hypothetical protein
MANTVRRPSAFYGCIFLWVPTGAILMVIRAVDLHWLVCLRWLDEVSPRLGLQGLVCVLACVFVVLE